MEEYIGQFWHQLITRAAADGYPSAAVSLREVERGVGVLFRAMGGDGGLRVETATAVTHAARRSLLQRIAGTHRLDVLAWRDEETLRLPERIALFPDPRLNRELYLWLAALAATDVRSEMDWFAASQRRTRTTLERFPGIEARYRRLVSAHLAQRPDPARLPTTEAAAEYAIRAALDEPGSVTGLPPARKPPQPVYLWLHPCPPRARNRTTTGEGTEPGAGEQSGKASKEPDSRRRRRAERVDAPQGDTGLLAFRLESLFSWAEYARVDRSVDDQEDPDAERAADDLNVLSVTRGGQTVTSRLRFDLDLPPAESDDTPVGEGVRLPEWDYRRQRMRLDHCRLQPLIAAHAPPSELPPRLQRAARMLRGQFQALVPLRRWHRAEPDGCDIDLDAWLQHAAERIGGRCRGDRNLYRDFRAGARDLACLLLADLSLSTDAWIGDAGRVIDVIRDSLHLFSEALDATGDRFALHGFSSRRRDHVRFHTLKSFTERYNAQIRGRIQAIRPGYYTRMGAAIRHAATLLSEQSASQRLLILLTDGKPNDLDQYEGRYGVEDTRMAIIEARRAGLRPFCVTIDERAGDYLPHLFGSDGFVVIRKPTDLPQELPRLYARLTR